MIRFNGLVSAVPVLMLSLALVACEKETPDGRVPAKYVSDAQASAGTYVGSMEGRSAKITLSVANDGTAKMAYKDAGNDIIGKGCGSQIGALRSISGKSGDFWGATFALATSCDIEGSSVSLTMKKNGGLNVSIVESSHTTSHYVCHGGGGTECDSDGHCVHIPNDCGWEDTTTYTYLTGKFQKQ